MKKYEIILAVFLILPIFACNNGKVKNTEEQSFFGCACSDSLNIIVGSKGALFKNSDGSLAWEKIEIGTDKDLLDAFYDGKTFYITGHSGVVFSSEDGTSWQDRSTNSGFHTFAISSNQQKIVSVGNKKVVLISENNASSWQNKYSVANKQLSLYDVAFGDDRWLAVGDYGSVVRIMDADNAVNEINVSLGTKKKLKGIAFDSRNKKWVACGHEGIIFVSEDGGTSWKEVASGTKEDLLSIAFNGKRFVAVGTNGLILTSKDASSWHKLAIGTGGTFRSVSCFQDKWLAITLDGKKELISDQKIER